MGGTQRGRARGWCEQFHQFAFSFKQIKIRDLFSDYLGKTNLQTTEPAELVEPREPKEITVFVRQRAKKVLSDSPGLVDFVIGLVNSVVNLPDGQVNFFEEFKL